MSSTSGTPNGKKGGKWKMTRHDRYYHLAKEQGYRSRAAFKLIQLNKVHGNFLGGAKALLDLCAAPGGWLQVAAKHMPVPSLIIGVDLLPMKPIRNVITLQEDITTQKCRAAIRKELQGWQVDVVLHDGAPNVGGATWDKDAYMQIELVVHSLKLATEMLRAGGVFCTKVFRSASYNNLLWLLKQFFKHCDVTKPAASRSASAEIFIVCKGYLAPKKIDPKLLDPAFVFKHIESKQLTGASDPFQKNDQKRQRGGYADDAKQILSKSISVADFVEAKDPLPLLAQNNVFAFDARAAPYTTHAATTTEIKHLCADLKVLGRADFKALLKWRTKLREFRKELLAEEKKKSGDAADADGEDDDADADASAKPKSKAKGAAAAALADEESAAPELSADEAKIKARQEKEMAELTARAEKRAKKELKKKRELKSKERKRMDLNMYNPQGGEMENDDQNLFTLGAIKDADSLDSVHTHGAGKKKKATADGDGESDGEVDENGDLVAVLDKHDDSDFSSADEDEKDAVYVSDEDETGMMDRLEGQMDHLYTEYLKRRNITLKQRREKLGLDEDSHLSEELGVGGVPVPAAAGSDDEEAAEAAAIAAAKRRVRVSGDDDDANTNPLLVGLDDGVPNVTAEQKAALWFNRDAFADIDLDGKSSAANGKDQKSAKKKAAMTVYDSDSSSDEEGAGGDDDLDGRWAHESDANGKRTKAGKKGASATAAGGSGATSIQVRGATAAAARAAAASATAADVASDDDGDATEASEYDDADSDAEDGESTIGDEELEGTDLEDEAIEDEAEAARPKKKVRVTETDLKVKSGLDDNRTDKQKKKDKKNLRAGMATDEKDGYAEVPVRDPDGIPIDDYSDDDDAKAEILALGKAMLRQKNRTTVINAAYNRYAWNDPELPEWFAHEEARFNKGQLPVTKAQVDEYKSSLKEINARPIKKIAEAKARKKFKTAKKWEKIKTAANNIANQEGTSSSEKVKSIEKLYAGKTRDKRSAKKDKKYVVSNNPTSRVEAKKTSSGGRTKLVDRRLKKDKKAMKRAVMRGSRKDKKSVKRKRDTGK